MLISAREERPPADDEPLLRLEGICAGYGRLTVLDGFGMKIHHNEIVALLGDNGAGKTTAVKAVAGLLPVTAGVIVFRGEILSGMLPHEVQQRGIGCLHQGGRVFANLTVGENIEIAERRRRREGLCPNRAEDDLVSLVLRDRWRVRAGLLSGGERQVLAIAMVFAQAPLLLVLDEPLTGLALPLAAVVAKRIASFAAMPGQAVLLVEQDSRTTRGVASRCVTLSQGRGIEA